LGLVADHEVEPRFRRPVVRVLTSVSVQAVHGP
jgi:hypothetical protein